MTLLHLPLATSTPHKLLVAWTQTGAQTPTCSHQVCLGKTSQAVTGGEAFGVEGDAQLELGQSGPARTACWVGSQGDVFATGHEMGQVLLWMIPLDASGMLLVVPAYPRQ